MSIELCFNCFSAFWLRSRELCFSICALYLCGPKFSYWIKVKDMWIWKPGRKQTYGEGGGVEKTLRQRCSRITKGGGRRTRNTHSLPFTGLHRTSRLFYVLMINRDKLSVKLLELLAHSDCLPYYSTCLLHCYKQNFRTPRKAPPILAPI